MVLAAQARPDATVTAGDAGIVDVTVEDDGAGRGGKIVLTLE